MSNHHLQNRELSLKAKGLLSEMLSLPETWDYTLKGLAIINKEGVDAIREAVRELERNGYIVRSRVRNAKGQLTHTEYVIYEQPANASVADGQPKLEEPMQGKPILEKPTQEDPIQDHSTLDNPTLENPTQINTYELTTDQKKKKEKIPDGSNPYQSIPYPSMRGRGQPFSVYQIRAQVKEQIEYDILCEQYDSPQLDDIVALMVDVRCGKTESYVISDVEYLEDNHLFQYQTLCDATDRMTRTGHDLNDKVKQAELRLSEIAVLKTHIINYIKTREVYTAYRKSGYSKKYAWSSFSKSLSIRLRISAGSCPG